MKVFIREDNQGILSLIFSLASVHCHLKLHGQKSFGYLVAVHFLNFVSLQVAAKRRALSNIDLLIMSCHLVISGPAERVSLCFASLGFLSLSVFQHSYISEHAQTMLL